MVVNKIPSQAIEVLFRHYPMTNNLDTCFNTMDQMLSWDYFFASIQLKF